MRIMELKRFTFARIFNEEKTWLIHNLFDDKKLKFCGLQ